MAGKESSTDEVRVCLSMFSSCLLPCFWSSFLLSENSLNMVGICVV